jgi:DNA replication and repair protein RecF
MRFLDLEVRNFRNFENLKISFNPRMNFFLGRNGQGKTNLLEAIFLLSQGRSFRFTDRMSYLKFDTDLAQIQSRMIVSKENQDFEFKTKLVLSESEKTQYFNEKKTSINRIGHSLPCVVFSPESISIIKSSAEHRRNLIDELVHSISPETNPIYIEFKNLLKTRNRILKDHTQKVKNREQTNNILSLIDPKFSKICIELSLARTQRIREIQPELNTAMRNISLDQNVDISVEYQISGVNLLHATPGEIEEIHRIRSAELLNAEFSAGTSLVGPHKHEIRFLYNQKDSRFFCSQGQQRAMILSFKMAQIVYHRKIHGEYPVLMLDDVLSELDVDKRNALIQFLHDIKTQIFITSTDLNLPESFRLERSSVVDIEDGRISKHKS